MNNIVFFIDQAPYHDSCRMKTFFKNNKLNVITNSVKNPNFGNIYFYFIF